MVRLVPFAIGALLAIWLLLRLTGVRRPALRADRRPSPPTRPRLTPRQRDYDWERRTGQLERRLKGVPGPVEERDRILAFLESRGGVEAWVEPKTVIHPLSVVLVAQDGEWVRIALRDDAFLRELSRERGLRIHDAMRVGYPERMRTYRRPHGDADAGS